MRTDPVLGVACSNGGLRIDAAEVPERVQLDRRLDQHQQRERQHGHCQRLEQTAHVLEVLQEDAQQEVAAVVGNREADLLAGAISVGDEPLAAAWRRISLPRPSASCFHSSGSRPVLHDLGVEERHAQLEGVAIVILSALTSRSSGSQTPVSR